MKSTLPERLLQPQAFTSSYAPRLRTYPNAFLTPVVPQQQTVQTSRVTKRGTISINYAEDLLGEDDFDDSDNPSRRATGLRSRREEPLENRDALTEKHGRELTAPVNIQGIWRPWMGQPKYGRTDMQMQAQSKFPLTLIPIRIDLDIPSFTPQHAFPPPTDNQAHAHGVNIALPVYRSGEPTRPFKLKDSFLWNLHETMITPEVFGLQLSNDLDLPNPAFWALQIATQIRQQLEEWAGIALHPLFHSTSTANRDRETAVARQNLLSPSRDASATPYAPSTPAPFSELADAATQTAAPIEAVTASATQLPQTSIHNPDDAYRCIVNISINLSNKLFEDRFEWSLLHPPGLAERFARQTCRDMGLHGEWVPTLAVAIYEAVLRLKKEVCENGGLLGGEVDNLAVEGKEAGWRYDDENLASAWEPRVETLTKDEIEKREGDREREIRRQRREAARISSTTNMNGGATPGGRLDEAETPMGRGERSKKKRRFRSLSPLGRSGTPGGASDAGYGGGGASFASENERANFRCSHCLVAGNGVWQVRDGPHGPRTLCQNCGLYYETKKKLPPWSKELNRHTQVVK